MCIEIDKTTRKIIFKFRTGSAKRVCLAGDFNNWNEESHPMQKIGDTWQVNLHLPPGEYRFKYLVDGFWHNDLEAHKYAPNAWGSDDSVVVVPEPAPGVTQ